MSRNRLVAAAALALLVAPLPAHAATAKKPVKPVCNLIKDPAGDATIGGAGATTYDPSLDIVSADIAVDAKRLTVAIRVKDLVKQDAETLAATGRQWAFTFTNGTTSVNLNAYTSPLGGERFSTGVGKFDYDKNEVHITLDLATVPNAKIVKNAVLRGFYLTTNVVVGLDPSLNAGHAFAPLSGAVDSTPQSPAAFKVGSTSCVKVGA